MVNQNKIFSFKIKRQAKNVFPRDVERTVALVDTQSDPNINCSVGFAKKGRVCWGPGAWVCGAGPLMLEFYGPVNNVKVLTNR